MGKFNGCYMVDGNDIPECLNLNSDAAHSHTDLDHVIKYLIGHEIVENDLGV